MRGVFAVDEPTGQRWKLALDLLRRGEAFSLGRITFRRVSAECVEAAVASTWRPENLTPARARDDLRAARAQTEQLLAADPAFREAVGGSKIDHVLVDDYDTGSITLCRLVDDDLDWLIPPPS